MPHLSPASWLALLSLLASGAAVAQPHMHPHADAPVSVPAPAQAAEPAPVPPAYRSAFDGYRPFADGPPVRWTEANGAARSAMTAGPAAAGQPDPHAGHPMPTAMPMPSHRPAHP